MKEHTCNIYCKVKPRIQRELSHTIKSRCACVWMYMVANLILLYSLKTYLSFKTWKQLCKKTWAILFIFFSFFSGGHLSTHCFRYLEQLSIFFNFFMNNFCMAQASFMQQNFSRNGNKNLEHLFGGKILTRFFCVHP